MVIRMEQRDFRGLSRATQEALRARAVYLVIETGTPQGEAAAAVGVSRQPSGGEPVDAALCGCRRCRPA